MQLLIKAVLGLNIFSRLRLPCPDVLFSSILTVRDAIKHTFHLYAVSVT